MKWFILIHLAYPESKQKVGNTRLTVLMTMNLKANMKIMFTKQCLQGWEYAVLMHAQKIKCMSDQQCPPPHTDDEVGTMR